MRWKNLLHRDIWLAVALLFILTLPFLFSDLDLMLQNFLYRNGWIFGDKQPWALLYKAGTLPGLLLAMGALIMLIGSWIWPRLADKRRAAALIILTLILGPGLLVNALGKEYWGRPRPRDVVEFNGSQPFHRICQPGQPGRGKSFPCGHASVGFLLTVLYFTTKRKKIRFTWLGVGLGYGLLMGVGRMTQGGHFASDVLWSGGLTYLSAAVLHHVILPPSPQLFGKSTDAPLGKRSKLLAGSLLGAALFLLVLFFLLATPFYKTWKSRVPAPEGVTHVQLRLPAGKEEIRIVQAEQADAIMASAELNGFGFPDLDLLGKIETEQQGNTLTARLSLGFNRITTERTGKIQLSVRKDLWLSLYGTGADGDIRINETAEQARLLELEILSRKGGILLHVLEGSDVIGPVRLFSEQGDIRVLFREIHDPGNTVWEIGNDRGIISLEAVQKAAPAQTLKLRGWSRFGDVALLSEISPACGLNLVWDEGDGRSGITAKGRWQQDGNRVYGPLGMAKANFEIFLATSNSLIGMELLQGEGAPLVALPTPTAKPTPWAGDDAFFEIAPVSTPTPEPPSWISTELVDISNKNYFKPRNPLEKTPEPDPEP